MVYISLFSVPESSVNFLIGFWSDNPEKNYDENKVNDPKEHVFLNFFWKEFKFSKTSFEYGEAKNS